MTCRRLAAVAVTVLFVAMSGAAAGDPGGSQKTLSIYATSDTDGRFAAPRCRETPIVTEDRLAYAHQVGFYRRLAERAEKDSSALAPVALHLGDSSYPGPIGRYLLSRGPGGAELLTRILNQIPYASHTLGNRDLGLRRSRLNAFADTAQAAGLPLRAMNVVCTAEGGAEAVCEAIGHFEGRTPYDVVERGNLRILLVSLVDPEIRKQIASARLTGLDVLDPMPVLKRTLPEFRRATNPDLVFLQYHAAKRTALREMVELTRKTSSIDLVMTNHQLAVSAGRESAATNGYVLAPKSGAHIVPTGRSPYHGTVTRLRLDRARTGTEDEWKIRELDSPAVDTRSSPTDPETTELLWKASRQLCRQWGEAIVPNAPLSRPFHLDDFTEFVLNVMRNATRTEIALINDGGIVQAGGFPIRRTLTYADVHTKLPYANPLVVVHLKGSTLEEIEPALGESVRSVGLSSKGNQLLVNGRPVDEDRIYKIATNRYLADGGDGILDVDDIRRKMFYDPKWSAKPPSIGETVIQFVQTRSYVRSGPVDRRLSPRGNFPNLHRQLLWEISGSVNTSFNQVAVANPTVDRVPVYNQSQLRVQPAQQLHLEGSIRADADSENHGWDNSLLAQYALAGVNSGGSGLDQTRDLIRAKSRYKYAGIRSRLGNPPWGPMPTAELQLETEFDPPPERDWQRLELTGILGSSFQLFEPFEVRAGLDLRRDLNHDRGETVYGLTGAFQLDRVEIFDVLESPVLIESELEYFFNDPFDQRLHELRTTNRLFFSLLEDLHLTSTFSAFLFRSGRVGAFGRNTEINIGLNYRWDAFFQTF